jgi:hypothetical protein
MIKHNLSTSPSDQRIAPLMLKIIVFLVILALILSQIGILLRKRTSTTIRWDTFYEKVQTENIDILMIGSSQSFRGIDPGIFEDQLEMTSFNLSNSAQVISQTYYALEEALRHTDPEIVILETYFINQHKLIDDRWYFAYEEVSAMKPGLPKTRYIFDLFTPLTYLDAFFPAIREHANWSDKETLEDNDIYLKTGVSIEKDFMRDGYVEDSSTLSGDNLIAYSELAYHEQDFNMTPEAFEYMKKITALLAEHDIDLLLVKTAMPKVHTEKTNESDRHAMMQQVADDLNLPFIDFNELYDELGFNNLCFRDEFNLTNHHLNTKGAQITTQYLVDYLKNNRH